MPGELTPVMAMNIRARIRVAYRLKEKLEAECARNYTPGLDARSNAAAKKYLRLCEKYPALAPVRNED